MTGTKIDSKTFRTKLVCDAENPVLCVCLGIKSSFAFHVRSRPQATSFPGSLGVAFQDGACARHLGFIPRALMKTL